MMARHPRERVGLNLGPPAARSLKIHLVLVLGGSSASPGHLL
jgi:hypothetical protein